MMMRTIATAVLLLLAAGLAATQAAAPQERQGFSFRTGVQLINIAATVTDQDGRFVPDLRAQDFEVYEDGVKQTIQQFEAERVPVSLGVVLDTSGSMAGEKIRAADAALSRFVFDLLGDQDEMFLYRFDSRPLLVEGWTPNRFAIGRHLGTMQPNGGTALYDAVAVAVPMAQNGSRRKKAVVVISDGQDTSSRRSLDDLVSMIRATEVLVYAIGIDASGGMQRPAAAAAPARTPSPFPGAPLPPARPASPSRPSHPKSKEQLGTLQRITDETGGRTELIVSARDLAPATANIADELSRQYFIGYGSSAAKDGRWHTIDVRLVHHGAHTVRARKGFVAN
ncbi:MAG: VWA domain-containing protein [Acidobacteria bacterium]|nr:VWA domain-containing protein [Acidobacteriota bacterium]